MEILKGVKKEHFVCPAPRNSLVVSGRGERADPDGKCVAAHCLFMGKQL